MMGEISNIDLTKQRKVIAKNTVNTPILNDLMFLRILEKIY